MNKKTSILRLFLSLLWSLFLMLLPYVVTASVSVFAFMWIAVNAFGVKGLLLLALVMLISSAVTQSLIRGTVGVANQMESLNDNSLRARLFWDFVYKGKLALDWISKLLPTVIGVMFTIAYFTQIHWVVVVASVALWFWFGNWMWNR